MTTLAEPSINQVKAIAGSNRPFNLWEGSIRSGKTFWSLIWLLEKIMTRPEGDGMLMGQTSETIERNFLLDFLSLMDSDGIDYNYVQKSHIDVTVDNGEKIFIRRMWIVGAKDKGAIKRVRGSTLMIVYVDELTLMPKIVFDELVGRLSYKESIMLATTNPDSPHHWVLKDYVESDEKKRDWTRWTFIMDDNNSLSPEYKERMKRQYSGLPARYQRMILGRWVMADGLVYDCFVEDKHVITRDQLPKARPRRIYVGGDYGTKNPTVFGKIYEYPHPNPTRLYQKMYVLVDEYYYSGRDKGVLKTPSAYLDDFRTFVGQERIKSVFLDPSATPLIAEFENNGIYPEQADNDVLKGIGTVANLIDNGCFYVLDTCERTIEEFGLYVWDEVASLKGIDRPIKDNDHAMDMVRYVLHSLNADSRAGVSGVSGW